MKYAICRCAGRKNIWILIESMGDNWTFIFSHYTLHLDLVRAILPKQQYVFWWNFTWFRCTICRCAWRKIFTFWWHLREIIELLFFSRYTLHVDHVSATPPKRQDGFWWNFTWLKWTICRCAWRKIIHVKCTFWWFIG